MFSVFSETVVHVVSMVVTMFYGTLEKCDILLEGFSCINKIK